MPLPSVWICVDILKYLSGQLLSRLHCTLRVLCPNLIWLYRFFSLHFFILCNFFVCESGSHQIDICVGVFRDQRKKSGSLLHLFLPYFLETRSLLNSETRPVTHKSQ